MSKLFTWLFGRHPSDRNSRFDLRDAPILPTPDTGPVRSSPPPKPGAEALPPLKNWSHPFKDPRNPLLQLTHLAKAAAGYYPLGINGLWHGGVHFDSGTADTLDQSSVQCLADGEVVAYRIDTHSPTTRYFINAITVEKPFSRNFVLVRHRLQPPKLEGSADAPPSLTFYSLYLHLQDWAVYQENSAIARPTFWPESPILRVKQTVNDVRPGQLEQPGLNVFNKDWQGKVLDLLPRGAEVTVSGAGDYRKLESSLGPAKLINADGSLSGYIAASLLQPIAGNEHRITSSKKWVNVRAEPVIPSEVLVELPVGTVVTVSGEGDFRKLERIHQYVHFASLQGALEPLASDRVVVLDRPVAIKAGELIGHLGLYQDSGAQRAEKKLHLEVFSGDDVDLFLETSRAWAQRLPDNDRTWLKLAQGTAVVTHQEHVTAAKLKIWSTASPLSAADLLVPKSLLDGLPADRKIQVAASDSRKACNWYRLDGLLHDSDNNLLDGWVCEEVGVTPWLSPWSWEGYDIIFDYSTPKHAMASFLSAVDGFTEAQRERYRPLADKDDKGPMKSRLYEIIDRDRNGKMTAEELQAALRLPAHAQAISQLIIRKESEWFHQAQKWDALDELLGHSGSTPHLNWLAEKQRIEQLSWWGEVAEKVGLPSWGKVYHFHPIGLVGNFQKSSFVFTLELMKALYPKLGASRYSDLKAIADELNEHIDFYKLDTPLRRTHFFAQILEETGENLIIEEDLSYRVSALTSLFSYFRAHPDEAREHGFVIRQGRIKENGLPMDQSDFEAIANGAYGARSELGNRGHLSGDGWRYRGRGLKQLTGLYNYKMFADWHDENKLLWPSDNVDFVGSPDLLLNMKYAVRSAVSFWLSNKIYRVADQGSAPEVVDLVTDIVNRGTGSRPDRKENFRYHWYGKTLM
jgi:predicted chitinase